MWDHWCICYDILKKVRQWCTLPKQRQNYDISPPFDFRRRYLSVLSEESHKKNATFLKQEFFPSYSHRSCKISLFCFFHWSLKSVENSCQMEKKVLGETSFSPALGFTEKDMLNSKKLRTENKNITSRPNYYNMRLQRPMLIVAKLGCAMQNIEVNLGIIWLLRDLMVQYHKKKRLKKKVDCISDNEQKNKMQLTQMLI